MSFLFALGGSFLLLAVPGSYLQLVSRNLFAFPTTLSALPCPLHTHNSCFIISTLSHIVGSLAASAAFPTSNVVFVAIIYQRKILKSIRLCTLRLTALCAIVAQMRVATF